MKKERTVLSWNMLEKAAMIYLAAPVFLFLVFWFNAPWNMLFVIMAGWGLYATMRKSLADPSGISGGEFGYTWPGVVAIGCLAAGAAFLTGAGAWVVQRGDYDQGNCFIDNLAKLHWPWAFQFADGTVRYVVYYFGYQLVPAIFGWAFGSHAADAVAFLSAAFGLWLGLMALGKSFKLPVWGLVLLFGFGSLNLIGEQIFPSNPITHFDEFGAHCAADWSLPLRSFSPLETLIFAPYHLLAPLLLLPLCLWASKRKRWDRVFAWLSLGLFWSPMSTIGVGLVTALFLDWKKINLASVFNWRTVCVGLGVVFPLLVFFSIRLVPEKLVFMGGFHVFWQHFGWFLFLTVIVWFMLLPSRSLRTPQIWIFFVSYVALCFWTCGTALDWLFRLGLPFLITLFCLVLRGLIENPKPWRIISFAVVYGLSAVPQFSDLLDILEGFLREPLYPYYRMEYGDYFERMSAIQKQYLGDKGKNIIAAALLKSPDEKGVFDETWQEALVRRIVIAFEDRFTEDFKRRYIFKGSMNLYLLHPVGESEESALSLDISNRTNSPIVLYLGREADPEYPWYLCSHLRKIFYYEENRNIPEVLQGRPREYENVFPVTVPPGGCRLLVRFSIKKEVDLFVLFERTITGRKLVLSNLLFRMGDARVKTLQPGKRDIVLDFDPPARKTTQPTN